VSTPEDLTESSRSLPSLSLPASTEFPYATLGQGTALFPVIEVRVEMPEGELFPFQMIPDSGATGTVLPRKYAVPLGFDLRECDEVEVDTGNGRAKQYETPRPLNAQIAGREIELHACFGNIGAPVLGRKDFFSAFYVEIDERNRIVKVRPHD
jgi:Aspartyl protease